MVLKILFNWLHFVSEFCSHKEKRETVNFLQIAVHPCVINKQPHIVYPRGLRDQSHDIFEQLRDHFQQQGYRLKEDQRAGKQNSSHKHERRGWAPVIVFTASLLFESSAHAEVELDLNENPDHQNHQVELKLVSNQGIRSRIEQITSTEQGTEQTTLKSNLAEFIFELLEQHYNKQDSDPYYVSDDFKQIANYYSEFPEVVSLLKSLDNKNWKLTYDEDNWVTVASGNTFEVEKAEIHFNTRSAAQLRLNNGCKNNPVCIASPADAMLHELLHTHSMLVNTKEFITQGGMNNILYPYKHEYSIIEAERRLYAKMSNQDTLKRPYRIDHTGRIIKTHCPTCIK